MIFMYPREIGSCVRVFQFLAKLSQISNKFLSFHLVMVISNLTVSIRKRPRAMNFRVAFFNKIPGNIRRFALIIECKHFRLHMPVRFKFFNEACNELVLRET